MEKFKGRYLITKDDEIIKKGIFEQYNAYVGNEYSEGVLTFDVPVNLEKDEKLTIRYYLVKGQIVDPPDET
jgi:hypothetical protein